MAQNFYEGLYILDSGQFARDPNGVVQQFTKVIEEAGGEFLVSRIWEERRLAYPIEGHRKGTYWLTYFKIDGRKLDEISKRLRHAPGILRFLFVKLDPRIVEVLIAHASGEAIEESPESDDAEAAEKPAPDAAAVQAEGETA
ncbi:MAG: 30S ribosomal protein S6 [Planctomycetota bacterium]|nr:MAG: 30S ribosomal protein S6 [Planctomycetota bacterium]